MAKEEPYRFIVISSSHVCDRGWNYYKSKEEVINLINKELDKKYHSKVINTINNLEVGRDFTIRDPYLYLEYTVIRLAVSETDNIAIDKWDFNYE